MRVFCGSTSTAAAALSPLMMGVGDAEHSVVGLRRNRHVRRPPLPLFHMVPFWPRGPARSRRSTRPDPNHDDPFPRFIMAEIMAAARAERLGSGGRPRPVGGPIPCFLLKGSSVRQLSWSMSQPAVPTLADDSHLKVLFASEHLNLVTTVGPPDDTEIDRGVAHPELPKRHLRSSLVASPS